MDLGDVLEDVDRELLDRAGRDRGQRGVDGLERLELDALGVGERRRRGDAADGAAAFACAVRLTTVVVVLPFVANATRPMAAAITATSAVSPIGDHHPLAPTVSWSRPAGRRSALERCQGHAAEL